MNAGDNLKAKYNSWKEKRERNAIAEEDHEQDTQVNEELRRRRQGSQLKKRALIGALAGAGIGASHNYDHNSKIEEQNKSLPKGVQLGKTGYAGYALGGAGIGAILGAGTAGLKHLENKALARKHGFHRKSDDELLDVKSEAIKRMRDRNSK